MKNLLLSILLLIPLAAWATPGHSPGGAAGTGVGTFLIPTSISLAPSVLSGEAPLDVEYEVRITGNNIGLGYWSLFCGTTPETILWDTNIDTPEHLNKYTSRYTISGLCTYNSAGIKTATLYSYFRGTLTTPTATVIVVEPAGSITTVLEVNPHGATEPVDVTLTANVIGETGNITCDFWCDAPYGPGDVDGTGDVTPVAVSPMIESGACLAMAAGTYVPKVECTRNAQTDDDTEIVEVLAQTLGVILEATPPTGINPLNDVILTAYVNTTCPVDEDITYNFDCVDGTGVDYGPTATADREYSIPAPYCDGYATGQTTASVTVDCDAAAQKTATVTIDVDDPPDVTFTATADVSQSSGPEPLNDVGVMLTFGGTATGDVTGGTVDCDSPSGTDFTFTITDPDNVDETGDPIAYSLSDYSTPADSNCDYATDATYTIATSATREGETHTDTAEVIVTPVVAPVPVFGLSPLTVNVEVLEGNNPNDVVLSMTNTGDGTLTWADNASESEAWLSCVADDGEPTTTTTETDTITCGVTSAALAVGTHQATVTYTDATAAPTTITATFNLTVTSSSPSDIHAVITPSRDGIDIDACTAPCAVFFHTEDTTQVGTSEDDKFIFLDYYWTFDDPGSGNWTQGSLAHTSTAQSKNVEYGPTAGHLFETPGDYTVELTVCDTAGDNCDSDTHLIRVADPDVVYATTATVCANTPVPVAGVDGCPAGAKVYDSVDFDDIWDQALGCNLDEAASNVRCLLRRGQTYTAGGQKEFYSEAGNQIGAYGATGADPIISSGSFDLFDDHGNWKDWTFYDVQFSAPTAVTGAVFYLYSYHTDLAHLSLIRITIEGFENVLSTGVPDPADGSRDVGGVYVYEMDRTDTFEPPGLNLGYTVWGAYRDLWIAGNTFGDPTNDDVGVHPEQEYLRLAGIQRGFIGHTLFHQGSGNAQEILKIHNSHRGTEGGAYTHSVQIVDNEILHGGDGWRVNAGPQSGGASYAGEMTKRFIFERNWYHSDEYVGSSASSTNVFCLHNANHMMVRNNIVDCSALSANVHNGCHAVFVNDRQEEAPLPEDNYIFNNTVTHFGAETVNIRVLNNDSGSINTDMRANLLHVSGAAGHSLYTGQVPSPYIDNDDVAVDPFVDGKVGMEPDDFKLDSADSVTAVTGVRRDFSGAIRPNGTHTRGAWTKE